MSFLKSDMPSIFPLYSMNFWLLNHTNWQVELCGWHRSRHPKRPGDQHILFLAMLDGRQWQTWLLVGYAGVRWHRSSCSTLRTHFFQGRKRMIEGFGTFRISCTMRYLPVSLGSLWIWRYNYEIRSVLQVRTARSRAKVGVYMRIWILYRIYIYIYLPT